MAPLRRRRSAPCWRRLSPTAAQQLHPTTRQNNGLLSPSLPAAEALDLHYFSETEDESPCSRCINANASKIGDTKVTEDTRLLESEDEMSGDTAKEAPRRIPSVVVRPRSHKVSYKDVLLKPRTFKPSFPRVPSDHAEHGWFHEVRRRTPSRKRAASVWLRLGAGQRHIQDGLGERSIQASKPCTSKHWLQLLKAKAGNRCFNCLAPDHCIGDCRDPPRCILCLSFGHKARCCRSTASASSVPSSVAACPTPRPAVVAFPALRTNATTNTGASAA